MKMRFFNRLLLALYALAWLLALAATAVGFLAPGAFQPVLDVIRRALDALPWLPYALLGLMAVWSLGMFCMAFKRDKRGEKGNVALQNTENGAVNIAVGALETMVQEAIGRSDEVLELKSQVINHEDSITVQVRMVLSSSAHIPNVTMLMQRNIKRFIEEFSGIAVREVVITVTEVRSPEPAGKKRGIKNGKAPESIMAPANPLPERDGAAESLAAPAPAAEPVSLPVQPEADSPAGPDEPLAPQAVDEPFASQAEDEPACAQDSEEEAVQEQPSAFDESSSEPSGENDAQDDFQEDDGKAPT